MQVVVLASMFGPEQAAKVKAPGIPAHGAPVAAETIQQHVAYRRQLKGNVVVAREQLEAGPAHGKCGQRVERGRMRISDALQGRCGGALPTANPVDARSRRVRGKVERVAEQDQAAGGRGTHVLGQPTDERREVPGAVPDDPVRGLALAVAEMQVADDEDLLVGHGRGTSARAWLATVERDGRIQTGLERTGR